MSDLAISLRHVSKSFKVARAKPGAKGSPDPRRRRAGRRDFLDVLIDLNCEVRRGQTLGVVGVNGSGKTLIEVKIRFCLRLPASDQGLKLAVNDFYDVDRIAESGMMLVEHQRDLSVFGKRVEEIFLDTTAVIDFSFGWSLRII